jgi:hypothetical protein
MQRSVMIYTATALTAIAATALGGITAASAASVPTKLTGVPKAAIAVAAPAPMFVRKAAGRGGVCAIVVPARTLKSVKGIAKAVIAVPVPAVRAIAVPALAPTGTTKAALGTPTTATGLARMCITVLPALAPRSVNKG